jgi:hypothetical protein
MANIMSDFGTKKKKYGLAPSFSQSEGKTGAQTASEGAGNLGRFGGAVKKGGADPIGAIQQYARDEQERKRKKDAEEAAKKKAGTGVAPQKGFIDRMMDKYWYGKKDE